MGSITCCVIVFSIPAFSKSFIYISSGYDADWTAFVGSYSDFMHALMHRRSKDNRSSFPENQLTSLWTSRRMVFFSNICTSVRQLPAKLFYTSSWIKWFRMARIFGSFLVLVVYCRNVGYVLESAHSGFKKEIKIGMFNYHPGPYSETSLGFVIGSVTTASYSLVWMIAICLDRRAS